jgi:hypothetical protein
MSPDSDGLNESQEEKTKGLLVAIVISALTFIICFAIAYSGAHPK